VSSDECHKAVALLIDKLDRMLRRRHRFFKAKRHRTNANEIETSLLIEAT
jgi:putative sigma-54 modulation protein